MEDISPGSCVGRGIKVLRPELPPKSKEETKGGSSLVTSPIIEDSALGSCEVMGRFVGRAPVTSPRTDEIAFGSCEVIGRFVGRAPVTSPTMEDTTPGS